MRIARLLLVVLAIGSVAPAPASAEDLLTPCRIERVQEALCGTVEVPEDPGTPSGARLPLRVVVLPATGADTLPDPMVYLAGGPGAAVTAQAAFQALSYRRLHERRDLVFVDQRGAGSESLLRCPWPGDPERGGTWMLDFFNPDRIRDCRERVDGHVHPEQYTTSASAADLAFVLGRLGYERVNLEGSSYGARVALEYLRRYPEGVRTAVLLGASPTDMRIPESYAPDTEAALESMLQACAREPGCGAAFPHLRAELEGLLAGAPYGIERAATAERDSETVTLTRGLIVDGIRRTLYFVDGAARLPWLIHAASDGDRVPLLEEILRGRRGLAGLSLGLYLSVTCTEDVPFIDRSGARALAVGTMLGEDRLRAQERACELWPTGEPAADFAEPVRADVPVLIVNGAIDPVTPPRHGRRVAEALPRATFVEVANTSHGMARAWDGCIGPLVESFVEAGGGEALDASCARQIERPPFLTGPPPSGGQERRLTLEDIRGVRTVSSPRLSPDGTRVVYVVSEPSTADRPARANLWLVDATGDGEPVRLTSGAARDRSPHWTRDGESVLFLSDRGDASALWTVPGSAAGGAPRRLTPDDVRVLDYATGPGATIAILVPAEGGQHIELFDPGSRSRRRLTAEPGYGVTFDWSPDGRTIAYSTQREPGFYGALQSDLFRIDVETGRTTPLVERNGVDRTPRYSPDGSRIAFVSAHGAEGGLLPNLGVAVIPAGGGAVEDLGRAYDRGGFFEGPSRLEWAPDGGAVYSNVSHGVAVHVVRLDLSTGVSEIFTDGPLAYDAPDVASSAARMAFVASSYGRPAEVFVTALDVFEPTRVTETNPEMDSADFPSAEHVSWSAPDGAIIHGLLVKPPGFDPTRRYPMVTILHGGPASAVGEGFWGMTFYNPYRDDLLAANGFLVLQPNPRGSGGFGEEFRRAAVRDWGRGPVGDVLAGVDHMVATGLADPERLGIAGWSYGGYLTAWAITQTDRFAAASVGAGVFDLESHFGQAREQMLEYFGAPPWVEPEAYERDSPSSFVGSITTPTQVIHGEADSAVSFAQGQFLAAALATIDVPHEFLAYPGEGHTILAPGSQDDAWAKVLAWFEHWLGDE